jgi:23S rRNA (adenine2503-C2)-methyltransferase
MIIFQSLTKSELADLLLPLSQVKKSGFSDEELEKKSKKRAAMRAQQIFHWVYQRYVLEWEEMSDLSKELRDWLKSNITIFRLTERVSRQALDGTHKFLWDLPDSKTIESVIIPSALQEKSGVVAARILNGQEAEESDDDIEGDYSPSTGIAGNENDEDELAMAQGAFARGANGGTIGISGVNANLSEAELMEKGARFAGAKVDRDLSKGNWKRLTACISSQVGCAMACKFCLTGVQGLDRSLETHEIVTQVHELRIRAPITNIVFMGMGEPLHNFEAVAKACEILLDQDGMSFSKRKVTVSTSGLVTGIDALGKRVDVSLAISLNATTDEQRSEIMPVNKRWNISELLAACRRYPLGSHRRITFEYVMLKDFNDSLEDAARLVQLTRGIPSKINLIPFNEHSGSKYTRPTDQTVKQFQKYLMDRKITATVRISRGRDILAACGQLRSIFGTARGTDRHKDWKELPVLQSHGAQPEVSAPISTTS